MEKPLPSLLSLAPMNQTPFTPEFDRSRRLRNPGLGLSDDGSVSSSGMNEEEKKDDPASSSHSTLVYNAAFN